MDSKRLGANGEMILAIILIGIGFLFLVGQLLGISLIGLFWPLFVIGPGVMLLAIMVLQGKGAGGLAIPGSIVTMVGLILFYQNVTGHWASWAYAWALIIAAVGVGIMVEGYWDGKPDSVEGGKQLAKAGLIIYIVAAVFFELILNISGSTLNRVFLPLLLIAGGLYLLFTRGGLSLGGLLRRGGHDEDPRQHRE